jgi:hypothetical protein
MRLALNVLIEEFDKRHARFARLVNVEPSPHRFHEAQAGAVQEVESFRRLGDPRRCKLCQGDPEIVFPGFELLTFQRGGFPGRKEKSLFLTSG